MSKAVNVISQQLPLPMVWLDVTEPAVSTRVQNLKTAFDALRDYLAANARGITRDETLARELILVLFCKVQDELRNAERPIFSANDGQSPDNIAERVRDFFEHEVKAAYPTVFESTERISLDSQSIAYVVGSLQAFHLTSAERDAIGDAFEVFIGPTLRGSEGQFFTPKNVVRLLVDCVDPQPGERVIDPACGSGGFLVEVFDYVYRHGSPRQDACRHLFGIDKDRLLARIAKTYLTLLGQTEASIYCENSLDRSSSWSEAAQERVQLGSFDVAVTNPPFGAKIPVHGERLLSQYELARIWKRSGSDAWQPTNARHPSQSPQILFIERCLQLVRDGGRIGIVLPEGVFGNPSERYIWEFIRRNAEIHAVISMPPETFQPWTHTKTSLLVLRRTKSPSTAYSLFMGIAERAGHNKNGRTINKMRNDGSYLTNERGDRVVDDDTPAIAERFRARRHSGSQTADHLGFTLAINELVDHIFIPEYYNPDVGRYLVSLANSGEYRLLSVETLVSEKRISLRRGNEIGSRFYGTGDVPFVRTTDVVNWEIKIDPVKCVSEELYEAYRKRQDIRVGDILFVNDGTFLIGRSAMVTELDLRIVIQSHLRRIRLLDETEFDRYYLFALLNTRVVRRQVEAKTFVQATISTLGSRLNEIVLPVHTNSETRRRISREIRDIIEAKKELRARATRIVEDSA
jgi:type I restriction enzyme M protein